MTIPFSIDWATLPVPEDDGGADHLIDLMVPDIALPTSDGQLVTLAALPGVVVVYAYPMTGRPEVPLPDGWDMLPGARGCTPQSCAFRDHFVELRSHGVDHLFGLSTQTSDYQKEAAERLHLPFPLLSDAALALTRALRLPTFRTAGMDLLNRLTMVLVGGRVAHVFYPVFPPTGTRLM